MITAVLAQDGGLVAAIFNLIVVAVVCTLGEWTWGWWRMLLLFAIPSLVLNLLAIGWGAAGGGSSFASDGLLLSICGLGMLVARRPVIWGCAGACVVIGGVLVVIGDAHGVAMLLGVALGLPFGWGVRGAWPARSVSTA